MDRRACFFWVWGIVAYCTVSILHRWGSGRVSVFLAGAAGLGAALAYSSRPDGLVYSFLLILWGGVVGFQRAKRFPSTPGRWMVLCAVFLLLCVLGSLPYAIYLRSRTGHWCLTAKAETNLMIGSSPMGKKLLSEQILFSPANNPTPERIEAEKQAQGGLLRAIIQHPGKMARRAGENLWVMARHFCDVLGGLAGILVLAMGMLSRKILKRCPERPGEVPKSEQPMGESPAPLLVLLPGLVILLPFHSELRYLLPVYPVLALYVSLGIYSLLCLRKRAFPSLPARLANGIIMLCLAVMFFHTAFESRFTFHPRGNSYTEMARLVQNAGLERGIIMARKEYLSFYLDWPHATFPYVESVEELLPYLRASRAKYLLIEEKVINKRRPKIALLADPKANAPPALTRILTTRDLRRKHQHESLVLYRVAF